MAGYGIATHNVLRLALGRSIGISGSSAWEALLEVARIERCAYLAWNRSGDQIRAVAPAGLIDRWRSLVLSEIARGDIQLTTLGEIVTCLEAEGIEAVVLKGPPLAHRIYGTRSARPSLDIDLFVAADRRHDARESLAGLGWTHLAGDSPEEEVFKRVVCGHQLLIELHSKLLDDPLFAGLDLPAPEFSTIDLEGVKLRAHDGPLMVACLAAHLAKHTVAPLVWLNDFRELWLGLDASERADATAAAEKVRLGKYLRWALSRVALLDAAAEGDLTAMARLGYHEGGRKQSHRLRHLIGLSQSPRDAWAVVWSLAGGFTHGRRQSPGSTSTPEARFVLNAGGEDGPGAVVNGTSIGVAGWSRSQGGATGRRLPVSDKDLSGLIQDAVGRRAAAWIHVSGRSMSPAIPAGAAVRLAPLPDRELEPGEVVLATLPDGRAVVHRVLQERNRAVRLRGDNNLTEDPLTLRENVVALVEAIDLGDGPMPVSRRARLPLWRLLKASAGAWRASIGSVLRR